MIEKNDLQPISGGDINKRSAVRSKDLSTRERVNFVLSSAIMEKLREKSTKDQIPMSRIIDAALISYLNNSTASYMSSSLGTGIILYHLLEILLAESIKSFLTKEVMNYTQEYFEHYTFSSCLLKKASDGTALIGTKVILFISDSQNEAFSNFLCEISKLQSEKCEKDEQSIKIFLDGKSIHI